MISPVQARETFNLKVGEQMVIYADKGFHDTNKKKFEAVGNVIIAMSENTIYGAKATLDFLNQTIHVQGNVRFVGLRSTFYGVSMLYNIKTKRMILDNARILSDNFMIIGKKIIKDGAGTVLAEEAEYTSCRDCPESWAIYGEKVKLVKNEYIYITNAFFKMKGVVVMYFPYIIFPIKKDRESGLLFPVFGSDVEDGTRFIQPWYWVINDHSDTTIAPAKWGNRGFGALWEYRYTYSTQKWFELRSIFSSDTVYNPVANKYTTTPGSKFRHLSGVEQHFSSFSNFNHHLDYQYVKDMDFYRDYEFSAKESLQGAEAGLKTFFEFRSSFFNLSTEAYYMKNLLYNDSYRFDKNYVQILPKVSFSTTPYVLFYRDSSFFNRASLTFNSDVTQFQNIAQSDFPSSKFKIRNATRLNLFPDLNIQWGSIQNFNFSSNLLLDYQSYHFPYQTENSFSKGAVVYETSVAVQFQKTFGNAIAIKTYKKPSSKKVYSNSDSEIIGIIPSDVVENIKYTMIKKNSYRHNQEWKLTHRYIDNIKRKGNVDFNSQISDESGNGHFDRIDAFRDQQDRINSQNTRTLIPKRNSLELQWNNVLIEKSVASFTEASVEDNKTHLSQFNYVEIFNFKVSQGILLDNNIEKIEERLTRLALTSTLILNPFSISFSDYYFYDKGLHVFSLSSSYSSDKFSLSSSFNYDPFASPSRRQLTFDLMVRLNRNLKLSNLIDYDVEKAIINKNKYSLLFNPDNNCWMLELSYTRSLTKDKDIAINFLINFNDNNYQGLSGKY